VALRFLLLVFAHDFCVSHFWSSGFRRYVCVFFVFQFVFLSFSLPCFQHLHYFFASYLKLVPSGCQRQPIGPGGARWTVNGGTALILAAKEGHAECVRALVEAGADTEFATWVRGIECFPTYHDNVLCLGHFAPHICMRGLILRAGPFPGWQFRVNI
jgi:hypothetical protein